MKNKKTKFHLHHQVALSQAFSNAFRVTHYSQNHLKYPISHTSAGEFGLCRYIPTKNLMKIAIFNLKVNPLTRFHRTKPNVSYHIVPFFVFGQSNIFKNSLEKKNYDI